MHEHVERDRRNETVVCPKTGFPVFRLDEQHLGMGASFGNAAVWINTKNTGATERIFSIGLGRSLFGSVATRYGTMDRASTSPRRDQTMHTPRLPEQRPGSHAGPRETTAGLRTASRPRGEPLVPKRWTWFGIRRLPHGGRYFSYVVVTDESGMRIYSILPLESGSPAELYDSDVSDLVEVLADSCAIIALARKDTTIVVAGNAAETTLDVGITQPAFSVASGVRGSKPAFARRIRLRLWRLRSRAVATAS